MKKIISLLLVLATAFLVFTGTNIIKVNAETTYILNDSFGRAPNCRTISSDMERKELNPVHQKYTEYGYGVRLKESSLGREYITYDVSGVKKVEVSAIIQQSNFGANHGWGLSLGVTDIATENPFNNTSNIDLNDVFPIYLSEFGHPFIFTQNHWWAYIAGNKYSFVPSTLDVNNQLRPFTVPSEVEGEIDTDGFTILERGYKYPMINVEYYMNNVWNTMVLDSSCYQIKSAQFIGGEKEYFITVEIKNIPDGSEKIRVGADYIRETLKGSSQGDTEADVYEEFPIKYYEAIYLTQVKMTLSNPYEGGFETLDQTGIAVNSKESKIVYGLGEDLSTDNLIYYDVYGDGIKERNYNPEEFTISSSQYNKYVANIYEINVSKGNFSTQYYVEVRKPESIILNLDGINLNVSNNNKLDYSNLVVTASTNLGTVNNKNIVEKVIPSEYVTVDTSKIDYTVNGTYEVTVSILEGMDKVSQSFNVTVNNPPTEKKGCKSAITLSSVCLLLVLSSAALFLKKNKHS